MNSTGMFGQMDPFIVVEYADKKYKTKVIRDGGKKPVWNECLEIPISDGNILKITCYDEDLIMDDFLAQHSYKIEELNCNTKKWFPLHYKTKEAARILIEAKYIARPKIDQLTFQES